MSQDTGLFSIKRPREVCDPLIHLPLTTYNLQKEIFDVNIN